MPAASVAAISIVPFSTSRVFAVYFNGCHGGLDDLAISFFNMMGI